MDFGSLKSSRVAKISLTTILDKIKWNSKPPSPLNQGWRRAKGKNAPFSHPWFGGEGGSRFSIYFVQDCNLGQNKMEQQTPIPPKSRMKPREGQKRAIFPSLIWRGRGGGSRFSVYFVQDCRWLVKGKNSRVPAAHPYPSIPKVPSPVWLLPVPS